MKFNVLLIILISSAKFAYCQDQTVIAKFVVLDARNNHTDVTQFYTSNKSYFVFYLTPDKRVYFGSIVSKSNQQSYGEISELEQSSAPQTQTAYSTHTFDFKWSYSNSYDNHQGTAKVHLVKIDKPAGIAFELRIIPENLDILEYKGFMEGSLNLN